MTARTTAPSSVVSRPPARPGRRPGRDLRLRPARRRTRRRWRSADDAGGRRAAVRVRRPDQRRTHLRRSRRRRQAGRLLRWRRVRRRVEDDRRRRHVEADLRRPDLAGHRRARRCADQPGHRLGRHRRSVGRARHGHDGRRHLQVHRRRRDVDQHGPRRHRPHRHHRRASGQREPRPRLRAGARDRAAAGTRRLPQRGRRPHVAAVAFRRREHRVLGSADVAAGSERRDRQHVGDSAPDARARERRHGQRHPPVARRRQNVHEGRASRPAQVAVRQDGRRDRPVERQSHVRTDSDRIRRRERPEIGSAGIRLAIGRWRADVGERELGSPAHRPRRLLHPHPRVARRSGPPDDRQQYALALARRRQDLGRWRRRLRRLSRHLVGHDADDGRALHRDRRRRHGHLRIAAQPDRQHERVAADRADVSRDSRSAIAVLGVRQPAGRWQHAHREQPADRAGQRAVVRGGARRGA